MVYVLVTNLIHSQEIYILHGYTLLITLTVILSIAKSTFSHHETSGGAHLASFWQYRVALPTDYMGFIFMIKFWTQNVTNTNCTFSYSSLTSHRHCETTYGESSD